MLSIQMYLRNFKRKGAGNLKYHVDQQVAYKYISSKGYIFIEFAATCCKYELFDERIKNVLSIMLLSIK